MDEKNLKKMLRIIAIVIFVLIGLFILISKVVVPFFTVYSNAPNYIEQENSTCIEGYFLKEDLGGNGKSVCCPNMAMIFVNGNCQYPLD